MGVVLDLKAWAKQVDWRHVVILVLLFVMAFGIRAYLLKYDLMFEFDTYWHTRMTAEIIQHGVPP
jgi:asparagine N-glycosylation enzyme membrane subunit Stt3